jgi:uncharacterized protein
MMNTSQPRIVSFRDAVTPEASTPEAKNLLAGKPQLTLWNHYADASNQFFAGVWASTRGKWRVYYVEHEFCCMTQGRVRISSADGEQWEFATGDSFVVPGGFEGTWEVLEDCRKLYVIFQPSAPS